MRRLVNATAKSSSPILTEIKDNGSTHKPVLTLSCFPHLCGYVVVKKRGFAVAYTITCRLFIQSNVFVEQSKILRYEREFLQMRNIKRFNCI